MADAAEECLVAELGRTQVRREDEQHVERHFKRVAAVQREVIDALFHGHDPAVEQLLRLDHLAAKVIDDQDAAVRLPLQRSDVELRLSGIAQLQFLQCQFTAGADHGAARDDPAAVTTSLRAGRRRRRIVVTAFLLLLDRDLMVDARIEHLDHGAVQVNGVGDEHLAWEHAADRIRDRALAVARAAVKQHRTAGVHGRAERRRHLVVEHEVGDGVLDGFRRNANR